jgi:NAD(P)-dependent dehydrogenase (short-subunit alcohol dehydrogenase family)
MTESAKGTSAWLISGCSTGIGREIALAALARGHNVAVTARNPAAVEDIVGEHPDQAISLPLDVTDHEQIADAVSETQRAFGSIDVLVNNAGYGYMAAVEEGDDADVRRMFDTNYFGAVDLIKATLPGMRRRRRGHIINISSMTGLVSNPPNVYYSSTKFALESLTEGLAKEVAPFGIRVTAIEPGAFRTDWATRSMQETGQPIDDYNDTVGARREMIRAIGDAMPGDPRKVGAATVMIADLDEPPLRLLLGKDVLAATRERLNAMLASMDEWEAVTVDVDFPTRE